MLNDEQEYEEIPEEEAPEQLKRKWIVEGLCPQKPILCPGCAKEIPFDSLTCLFCGAAIYHEKAGLLTRMLRGFKSLFGG